MSDLVDKTLKELTIDQLKNLLKKEREYLEIVGSVNEHAKIYSLISMARIRAELSKRGVNLNECV